MASDRRHWILVPAAGTSLRFKQEGYSTPKPLLRVEYRGIVECMISHVLDRVPEYEVLIAFPTVQDYVAPNPWRSRTVVVEKSGGQADTVLQMLSVVPDNDSVTTIDCDVLLETDDIRRVSELVQEGWAAAVAVARDEEDAAMSRVNSVPCPTLFAEKQMISPWGMVSARAFQRAGDLKRVLHEVVREFRVAGREPYLSEVLNRYPGNKFAHVIHKWADWGTPEKLRNSGATIV